MRILNTITTPFAAKYSGPRRICHPLGSQKRLAPGQAHNLSQQWHMAGAGGWVEGGPAAATCKRRADVDGSVCSSPAMRSRASYSSPQTTIIPRGAMLGTLSPEALSSRRTISGRSPAPLAPLSIVGGQQRVLGIAAFLTDGKWWMYAGGKAPANAIGYVPSSWWNGGPLATGSTRTEFGGEVAGYTNDDGIRRFGGMGSGGA